MKEQKKTRYRSTFIFEGARQYAESSKSQRDADRKADIKKQRLESGEVGITKKMFTRDWIDQWYRTYKEPSIGSGQQQNYSAYIKTIKAAVGNKRLCDVKYIELQAILNQLEGKSKSYLSHLRYTIKDIFSRARKNRLIIFDPSEDLELPKSKDGSHRSITEKEREKLLAVAAVHRAGLWVKMMLFCGLRPGETRALDWRHIDIKNGYVTIEQAMKAGTKEIGAPKSAAGVRKIPIPDDYLKELKKAYGSPFSPVFIQPTTKERHTKQSMRSMWKNFRREWNIMYGGKFERNQIMIDVVAPDLVPYCLRHTYGTDLQAKGVQINVAKYLMGHSDISTTANIYTHMTDEQLDDVKNVINGVDPRGEKRGDSATNGAG